MERPYPVLRAWGRLRSFDGGDSTRGIRIPARRSVGGSLVLQYFSPRIVAERRERRFDGPASPDRSRRWRRIRAPCWRWCAKSQRQTFQPWPVKLHELADHAALSAFRDGHTKSWRSSLRKLAPDLEADYVRDRLETGWPSMAASVRYRPSPSAPRAR